jgi:uncharacterized protein (DUF2141 family)
MIHAVIVAVSILFAHVTNVQSATVVIEVKGISVSKGGEISTGLFEETNFPKPGKQLIGKAVPVNASEMKIVFNDVPPGKYGVVAFQDIDGNKDLKKNFLGFPKEPIGFSNDARIKMGPPSFSDAAIIVVPGKVMIIQITLR